MNAIVIKLFILKEIILGHEICYINYLFIYNKY